MEEAPVCSVEAGPLFSMQTCFSFSQVHLSLLSMLSLQIILTLFIKKHPLITYLCCLEQPSYLVSHINPPTASKPSSKNSRHSLALLVSFLLCHFDVVIQLNGNFPQKTGYVPLVTFFHTYF